ncbi:hypothetical protein [Pseudomonas sp. Marseille-Q5115]|uniref:hypothetical protein n=1 Tax=Pseudomonas sp. Marseille-Q5115 TaxID=2866593 RepID=UPI001CE3F583|nr:hypothetical protein [Pseudomonas sp. Marseille-Q5115]
MRVFLITLGLLALSGAADAASATAPAQVRPGVNANPLNSPIRRINPNSRQGTVPSNPAQRGLPEGYPGGRPPTLENGGIGNGQRFPRPAPAPREPADGR